MKFTIIEDSFYFDKELQYGSVFAEIHIPIKKFIEIKKIAHPDAIIIPIYRRKFYIGKHKNKIYFLPTGKNDYGLGLEKEYTEIHKYYLPNRIPKKYWPIYNFLCTSSFDPFFNRIK